MMLDPTLPAAPKSACSDTGQLHVGEAPTASNNSGVMTDIRRFASIVYQYCSAEDQSLQWRRPRERKFLAAGRLRSRALDYHDASVRVDQIVAGAQAASAGCASASGRC